ncbi:MAG: 4Fe-4S binding protein [Methanomassiliicoccales archaeon]|nr:MAG: 4Fe-4S binding protein [Methanomassiliicoccales archaeon]
MGLRTDLSLRIVKRSFDKRFTLARLTKVPMVGSIMEMLFFEDDDIIILPKDDVFMKARSRSISMDIEVERKDIVVPSAIIDHFIERSRYIFKMDKCVCRDSNNCRNYPKELGCIFLGKGTTRIPKHLGKMITAEEAKEHMRRCREAGLVHLIGRDKIDSVVFATGPKEDLLSICSCCHCCCLWKMVPDLSNKIGSTLTKMPGIEIVADAQRCTGCSRCVNEKICYVNAISIVDGKVRIDDGLCKGCGRCVEFCRSRAIELRVVDDSYIERSIRRIEPLVDVVKE